MATPSYHNRKIVPLRPRPLTPTQRALLDILYRCPAYVLFDQPAPDAPGRGDYQEAVSSFLSTLGDSLSPSDRIKTARQRDTLEGGEA